MNKIKFSGGDTLQGIEKKLHEILMQTELNNGFGAYELSYAEAKEGGNSGLSFGGNQMDLSNPGKEIAGYPDTYLKIFLDIIENATNASNKIISETEYELIKDNKKISEKGLKPETVFKDLLPKVNAALSSEYGIAKLNEIYRLELKATLSHVYRCINAMKGADGSTEADKLRIEANKQAILANEEMILRLADFHNQFDLDIDGKMMQFLSGDMINFTYKKHGSDIEDVRQIYLQLSHKPEAHDIITFIRSTNQYHKNSSAFKGQENRLAKLDKIFGHEPDILPVDCYDFQDNVWALLVGNMMLRLSGNNQLYTRSIDILVDKEHTKSLKASIVHNTDGWLTVNNKIVYENIPGIHNNYVKLDYIEELIATPPNVHNLNNETIKTAHLDLTNTIEDGPNHITLNVIVDGDNGLSFMHLFSY
jgi:hypothetical protein